MQPEAWFIAELAATWPRLRVAWERYRKKEVVIPLLGDAFIRIEGEDGVVEHLYLGRHDEPARPFVHAPPDFRKPTVAIEDDYGGRWYANPTVDEQGPRPVRPDASIRTDGRFVIREACGRRFDPKVVDVVDEDGRLHPLDRYVIARLAARVGGYERAEREVEANEQAEQAELEAKAAAALLEPYDRLAQALQDCAQVGYTPRETVSPAGYRVIDRRRFADARS